MLGKKFQNSGLDDLLIESGAYAAGTMSAIMKGKSYNRGVRAYKLAMEALFRLQWETFVTWYKSDHGKCEGLVVNEDAVVEKAKVCRHAITAKDDVQPHMEERQKETLDLYSLFDVFKGESKANSKLFALWEEYSHMVKLLLQFVKVERSGY